MSEHDHGHNRAIDRWLKYVAILGPMISGIVFGAAGYIGGFNQAKDQIRVDGGRIDHLELWKDKQEDFDQKTVQAIARIKALIKDSAP